MFRKSLLGIVTVLTVGTVLGLTPTESFAGKVGGPLMVHGFAGRDDYDTYTVRFEGGKLAHVFVKSLNRADLDIKIIDPVTLQVVAQDLRAAKDAHIDFMPSRTKEYIILIHNYSRDRATNYILRTN